MKKLTSFLHWQNKLFRNKEKLIGKGINTIFNRSDDLKI
jgi:hypothetical protein